MSAGEFVIGFALFVPVLTACAFFACTAVRRRLPELAGVPRALAICLLFLAALIGIHVLAGTVGALSRETVLVLALGLALIATFLPQRPEFSERDADPSPAAGEDHWSRRIALLAFGGASICLIAAVVEVIDLPILGADATNFHLPTAAAWIQERSIWEVRQLIPEQANAYYPQHGNVLQLAVMLPWSGDFLARLPSALMLAVGGGAVFAAARELRATTPAAALVATAFMVIPIHAQAGIDRAIPDPFMIATLAIGVLFLLRYDRTARTFDLILSGLALGLALGSRWHGTTAVVLIFAVWLVFALSGGPRRKTMRDGVLLAGVIALTGGIWLLRNWVLTGNPIFPAPVSVFGLTVFDAPPDPIREQFGFTLADYAGDWQTIRDTILPSLRDALALPAVVIAASALLGAVAIAARRANGSELDRRVLWCAASALAVAVAYVFTPYSALGPEGSPAGAGVNSRYVVPALVLAAPVAARFLTVAGRWRRPVELLFLVAIVDGARLAFDLGAGTLVAASLLVGGSYLAYRLGLLGTVRELAFAGRVRSALAVALVLAAAFPVLYLLEDRFADSRYFGAEPALDLVLTEDVAQSVALAGVWTPSDLQPPYPAFGSSLQNDVEYLGRGADERPQPYRTRSDFENALNETEPDVLILGLSTVRSRPDRLKRWIEQAGYRPAAGSDRLIAYVPN